VDQRLAVSTSPAGVAIARSGADRGRPLPLLECFGRFAVQGRGTPAPIAPTERLVVTGPYPAGAQPIYVAVVALILGQAALFADLRLALCRGHLAGLPPLRMVYESRPFGARSGRLRGLHRRGARWLPRLAPWRGGG